MIAVALGGREPTPELAERFAGILFGGLRLSNLDHRQIALAIGGDQPDWTTLAQSLPGLDIAASAAGMQAPQTWHDARRMSVSDLLYGLLDYRALHTFVRQQLGPLLDRKVSRNAEMLETLQALFKHGGRKADAARELHLNRQSFYYRLDRLEEMLEIDLGSEDTQLSLHLAIRALPMLERRGHALEA